MSNDLIQKEHSPKDIASTNNLPVQKTYNDSTVEYDVEKAKKMDEVRTIRRRSLLSAARDYLIFGISTIVGISCIVVGGLEYLSPQYLTIVVDKPLVVGGVGLGLIGGQTLVGNLIKYLKQIDQV